MILLKRMFFGDGDSVSCRFGEYIREKGGGKSVYGKERRVV